MKLHNVSLLRAISFCFIVAFHIVKELVPIRYRGVFPLFFAVQIFLFISGLLYANKSTKPLKSFYHRNIIKLVIPVLFLFVIYTILIFCKYTGNFESLRATTFLYSHPDGTGVGHLWYIPAMLACYLVLPLIQKALDTKNVFLIIIIVLLLGGEATYVCLDRGNVFFLPFLLGVIFGKYFFNVISSTELRKARTITLTVSALVFVLSSLGYFFLDTKDEFFGMGAYNYIVVAQAISFALVILISFTFLNKKEKIGILSICDKYSFYIYLYHNIFIAGQCSLMSLTNYTWVNILVSIAVTIIMCIFMESISNKTVKSINKLL